MQNKMSVVKCVWTEYHNKQAKPHYIIFHSKLGFLASFQNRPQSIKLVLCFFLFLLGS